MAQAIATVETTTRNQGLVLITGLPGPRLQHVTLSCPQQLQSGISDEYLLDDVKGIAVDCSYVGKMCDCFERANDT
jgi:hypothetical protein